ncbi:DUF881 domain-containing protein [Thermohalobacter berrensis]|uniref:Division initiation protein n=1 Tax=Thermohalobacter berrensis TaxID=99594 RepID=A0A419TA02_9FIRM|nr:DUF881 domain-containing protein [Thermohalobacter berrensis]RKD34302.1 division initiation protein [Thermohalobacter berrensis]
MAKLRNNLAIIFVCIILGIILAIQFKTVNKTVGSGVIPTQRAQQLVLELKKLTEERDRLIQELDKVESKLKQYEDEAAKESVYVENLTEELEKYRIFAGYEKVHGPGIIITVEDPPLEVQFGDETSVIVNNYQFLLEIISNLNAAGAEAISINGQRYTNYTEIVQVGTHVNINGVSFNPPFIIKAIGKPEILEAALRIKGGIIWYMENMFNLDVQIKAEDNIEIPRYTKIKEFRYAKPVDELPN